MKVGTGLAVGPQASADLAANAVATAMTRADLSIAGAVLLYLSADFAPDARAALTAAARAANCMQVAGCTAAGVFTDEDWVLDAPAAAAMVLGEGPALRPRHDDDAQVLTLAAPNALDLHWLSGGGARFGGVAGDASGRGPYGVWAGGRVHEDGRAELALTGVGLRLGVSQGVRPLCAPAAIDQVDGHDVRVVGGEPALVRLARELPLSVRAPERIPTHLLMAGIPYGDPDDAMASGRYHLLPVVAANADDKSVTVAGRLRPGMPLFWALRQPAAAARDMAATIAQLADSHLEAPRFALMFPCMGRGPLFYGGDDRDLRTLAARFPDMPIIGFYGNGEIAHLDGANRLLQYSVVLALAYQDD